MLRTLALTSLFLAGCYDFSKFEILPDMAEAGDAAQAPDAAELPDGSSQGDLAGVDLTGSDLGPDLAPSCTGACVPGAKSYTADGCMVRTCSMTCTWSSYDVKPGAQCGTTFQQSCMANGVSHIQKCTAACLWGPCQ